MVNVGFTAGDDFIIFDDVFVADERSVGRKLCSTSFGIHRVWGTRAFAMDDVGVIFEFAHGSMRMVVGHIGGVGTHAR